MSDGHGFNIWRPIHIDEYKWARWYFKTRTRKGVFKFDDNYDESEEGEIKEIFIRCC